MRKIVCTIASALIGLSSVAHADVIVEFGAGSTGSGFAAGIGQSVTTPDGGPWNNITFNFYDSGAGNPQAEGNLYVFDTPFAGAPRGLSSATADLLGVAAASDSLYVFDTSLTLSPDTQYFFYCDTRPGGPGGTTILGDGYSGGEFLRFWNGDSAFDPTTFADVAFSLQGVTAAAAPEPSVTVLGLIGLAGFAFAVRRRTVAR